MELTVLSMPDCPNTALLAERLRAAGVPADRVILTTVTSPEQAVRLGMQGSPTLLVEGADPFAEPDSAPAMACRLYRSPDGNAEGAPTVAALREALAASVALRVLTLAVPNMTCGNCQRGIEEALYTIQGVAAVGTDLASHSVTVTFRPPADRVAIGAAIEAAGFGLAESGAEA